MFKSIVKWLIFLLCFGLLLLAACRSDQEPTPTPTAVTVEPPPTPPVTSTPAEATATPTATATATPTGTATPTSTATPTDTPQPPPTSTPAPTATATAQPPPTPTATPTGGATVLYFRANVTEADPGDPITLEWATIGAKSVTLWRLMATGQLGEFWDVPLSGSFDYVIPEHYRNWITFALAVTPAQGEPGPMSSVQITLRCPDQWFFDNPPDICPAQAALVSAGAEQHFQGGIMLWSAAEDRIYVLYAGGQNPEWAAFSDEWDPGEPENDPNILPPSGFYQPVRGFGLVWREQPGVRDRLGWAVDEEAAYQTAVQRTSYAKYNETYIRAVDGGVWRLEAEHSGWGKQ